jgi:hypothetical protein
MVKRLAAWALLICGLSASCSSPPPPQHCQGDPCCGDPCCGDPCCGDPCCGDPCCGDPCCGDPCCGDPCCGDPCCGDPSCLQSSGSSSSSVVRKALRPAGASTLPAALEKDAGGAARGQCVMNGNRGS